MRPHLSVGQLGIVVGVAAMVCGALFAADNDATWLLFATYPLVLLTRRGRPLARWCPVVIALAIVALSAAGLRPVLDGFCVTIASLLVLAVSPALAWRRGGGTHRLALVVAAACVALMISVAATRWPLRLAFLASRSDFNAVSARLEAGFLMTKPERVGRFLIRKAELRDGRPCLWIDIDPAGFDGFVRNPRRAADGSYQGLPNSQLNLWWDVQLDDDWAFISED